MAGKPYFGRGVDIIDDLLSQLSQLTKDVTYLQNTKQPTVPLYATGDFPDVVDSVEGQVAINPTNEQLYMHVNSTWKSATGGGGISFDIDNIGGWLYIQGNDSLAFAHAMSPSSIALQDGSGGGIGIWDGNVGGGISLVSGSSALNPYGVNGIQLRSDTDITMQSTLLNYSHPINGAYISAGTNGAIILHADPDEGGSTVTLYGGPTGSFSLCGWDGSNYWIALNGYGVDNAHKAGIRLQPGVYDNGAALLSKGLEVYGDVDGVKVSIFDVSTGSPIEVFRIQKKSGGSTEYHIKTGASWVADL